MWQGVDGRASCSSSLSAHRPIAACNTSARSWQQYSRSAAPCGRRAAGDAAGPLRVLMPTRSEQETALKQHHTIAAAAASPASLLAEITVPVEADMEQMNRNLKSMVGNRHPMLMAAADQIFGAGGKKLRPMIVLLVARATAELAGLR